MEMIRRLKYSVGVKGVMQQTSSKTLKNAGHVAPSLMDVLGPTLVLDPTWGA